jgi:plastocyanin
VSSGNRGSGTFQRTFTDPGEFDYLCTIHGAGMSGTITVVAP